MKSRYVIRPKADADLDRQALYLSEKASPEVGHRFLVAALQTGPPGNHKLFASEYAIHDVWQYPLFLQRYETLGKPIGIQPGKAQEVHITVVPVGR